MGQLQGKVAVITGGTSGIGEGTVRRFVEEGARVVISGRNADKGLALVEELGPNTCFCQADVRREADVQATIAMAVERFGRLDCLFNNAGAPTAGSVETLTEADFRDGMDVLLFSVLTGIKHAAPIMKAQGSGTIINNSSVAAGHTHLGDYIYSIAKAAVVHATRMAGMELGRHGVTVNSIAPGVIATPIFYGGSAKAAQLDPGEADRKLTKLTRNLAKASPLMRTGTPIDIANAVVFLASDAAAFVNCHDLVVDGGMTAGGRVNFE